MEIEEMLNRMKLEFPEQKEVTLRRFLLCSRTKGDYDACKGGLLKYLEFRQNIGEITYEHIKNELEMGSFFFHGKTKTNNPIIVVRAKNFIPSQRTNGVESVVKLNVWVMERVWEENTETESCTLIVDCGGLSLSNISYETLKEVARVYNEYYPEVLFREFLLNTPWIFRGLWSWLKNLMDDATKEKIFILGNDFKDELFKYVDEDQLLVEHGGTSSFEPTPPYDLNFYRWRGKDQ